MKEMDKMEEKFYFRDEKLAMAQERISVLEAENASLRDEKDEAQRKYTELV